MDPSPKPSSESTRPSTPLVVGGVVIVAIVALVVGGILLLTQGGSSDDSSSSSLTSPQDLAPNVALVTHVPSSLGLVTRPEFDRAMEQTATQSGLKTVPPAGADKYGELKESALREILNSIWVQGQAAEMGIAVTPGEIAAELAQIKKQDFKTATAYQKFLETSHYTDEDVNNRVKLQLLSTRVQEKVSNSAPKGKASTEKAQQEAFTKFVTGFQRKWKSRTVCAPTFAIEQCSNGKKEQAGTGSSEAGSSPPRPAPGG